MRVFGGSSACRLRHNRFSGTNWRELPKGGVKGNEFAVGFIFEKGTNLTVSRKVSKQSVNKYRPSAVKDLCGES